MTWEIIQGDCLAVMKTFPDNHFSAIVTDPPYGLGFMGKEWDYGIPGVQFWKEALRICKPGSHLLAFGGTRTYHRLTCAIEDSGWEIRDCLMWIYGSGFPKSHNKFGLDGYGTALKPAYEPITLAMKPLDGTFKQNAAKWGQAGINIDGCRIGKDTIQTNANSGFRRGFVKGFRGCEDSTHKGRWPSNILLDEEAARMLDEQSGISKSSIRPPTPGIKKSQGRYSDYNDFGYERGMNDSGGASRFFYCAKTSSKERNEGLDNLKHVLYNETILLELEESKIWEELGLKANIPWDLATSQNMGIIDSLFGTKFPKLRELFYIMCTSGKRPSGRFLKVLIYTTLMATNKITASKIFEWLIRWSIKESIPDASLLMEYGINPVSCAENSKLLMEIIGISLKKDGHFTDDAENVISPELWLKKEQERLEKDLSRFVGGHPTVKPLALMRYLITLIAPQKNALILDLFAGSGSTILAAKQLGIESIGIEKQPDYCEIARKRIDSWEKKDQEMQMNMF